MNWDAIGAIGEVVGAIAVVASLVYLARQISQNSSLVEQSAAATRAKSAVTSAGHGADSFRWLAGDTDLTRIWFTALSAPGELSEAELRRFDLLLMAQIIEADVNYALFRQGALDPEVWAVWDRILDRWLLHPRFHHLWTRGALPAFLTASLAGRIGEKLAARSEAAPQ
jgi:hypothetical protein